MSDKGLFFVSEFFKTSLKFVSMIICF